METIKPHYDKEKNLRPLYDDYMKYRHAKNDAERKEAIERLLKVHNLDILKIENEI